MASRNATQRPLRLVAWATVAAAFTYAPRGAATETDAAIGMLLGAALAVALWFTRND